MSSSDLSLLKVLFVLKLKPRLRPTTGIDEPNRLPCRMLNAILLLGKPFEFFYHTTSRRVHY